RQHAGSDCRNSAHSQFRSLLQAATMRLYLLSAAWSDSEGLMHTNHPIHASRQRRFNNRSTMGAIVWRGLSGLFHPVRQFVGMLLFLLQNLFDHAARGVVLVAD